MDRQFLSVNKNLSADPLVTLVSKAISAMATGKKTTVGYRAIVLAAIGALIGNVLDVKGLLAPLSKLPTILPVIEAQGVEIKELRRLREEDHRAIEEVREILRRNKIGSADPAAQDVSTAQFSE